MSPHFYILCTTMSPHLYILCTNHVPIPLHTMCNHIPTPLHTVCNHVPTPLHTVSNNVPTPPHTMCNHVPTPLQYVALWGHGYTPLWLLHSNVRDFNTRFCHVLKISVAESTPEMGPSTKQTFCFSPNILVRAIHLSLIYPLTARVVGAPQMILQPVSSIFPCSPLPSGTCQTPGQSIP